MKLEYMLQPPKKWTFEQPKLKRWVEKWCIGDVLNVFAGKIHLNVLYEIRIDISPEFNPDICSDALSALMLCNRKFDTIILDPPYNIRKGREKYHGKFKGRLRLIKELIPGILNDHGRVISLGYSSTGMGKKRGFKKIAICLVCHSGDHNDTICLVEEKLFHTF